VIPENSEKSSNQIFNNPGDGASNSIDIGRAGKFDSNHVFVGEFFNADYDDFDSGKLESVQPRESDVCEAALLRFLGY